MTHTQILENLHIFRFSQRIFCDHIRCAKCPYYSKPLLASGTDHGCIIAEYYGFKSTSSTDLVEIGFLLRRDFIHDHPELFV